MMNTIQPIAMYLPQFHPIPENDAWWGKGFTEWNNVVKAKPRFKGHYQPHLPADLGFYDLRLEETRLAQEAMAKEYGIYGFCYYHYWFNGKRLLEEPLNRKLANPAEDLPFMLCWANENWTRAWDGTEHQILIGQNYSPDDDKKHLHHLHRYFSDDRYIKVDGKPVLLIYRPALFPDIRKTLDLWRKEAEILGYKGLHLGYVQSWKLFDPPQTMGFDFGIEFHPFARSGGYQWHYRLLLPLLVTLEKRLNLRIRDMKDHVMDYRQYALSQMHKPFQPGICPGITPMWDNSARRKRGALIWKGSTPEIYYQWLKHIVEHYPREEHTEQFLFINAWNEWAEGNHLEPCRQWGRAYLEMTKRALTQQ